MRFVVKQVVGRHRGWGASISEVLDGVNRIIKSNKKDDYVSQLQHAKCMRLFRSAGHRIDVEHLCSVSKIPAPNLAAFVFSLYA